MADIKVTLQRKVSDFLKTPAGQAKVQKALEPEIKREVLHLQNAIVQAQHSLPFSFGVDNEPIEYVTTGDSIHAECDITFNHEDATREAFYAEGKWPEADLIYLFQNTWNFESEKPPHGIWHDKYTIAATSGPVNGGEHFLTDAVNDYLSSAPSGIDVELDESYKQ